MFQNNRICRLLDIKYPLLQGGMAWIAGGKLAAAVSQAGGLGIIGAGGADETWLKEQIRMVKSLTDKPFGVNLMLASPNIKELIQVVVEEKVSVVTTGAGNPGIYMDSFKKAGIKVIPVVASVALAKRLVRLGADAVIAEGMESGGHVGEMSTMCLVPMVADAVDVPVIAAGGIADGRGFMAAFALGAEGVQVGTRFICAEECEVHPAYKEKVIKARDRATVVCGISTGHPVRAIHNKFTRHYLECEFSGMKKEELEELGRGRYPEAALKGEVDNGTVLAGEIAGLVKDIKPAGLIVEEIIAHALAIKEKWEEF
ncbi:enoyl-[acyl-carrier protein] reductase II [Thermosyntropha lipolytica DSM 11003]|uniref:Probable nitronate monooxygenase n=1 Tax=Thermosyntropha lipolytica DSM 11003 TaxID=1123382 RepID=A0A1M5JDC2_9FIRM|nr:enoyl-[acyl-carrier-protein] reductase FabK [Thermosyntropha lipolytica]SHG38596.1 enoyl-[acyl-carrier protein] reductase II [Thermosyntropha lipolytica DSM 11003]